MEIPTFKSCLPALPLTPSFSSWFLAAWSPNITHVSGRIHLQNLVLKTVIWFSPLISFSIFPFLQIWGKLKAWELVRLWKVLQRLSSDWHCFLGFLEFSQPKTDLSWNDEKFSAVLQRCGECPQNLNYRRGWQFLLHLFSSNCYRHLVTKVIFLSSGFSSLCQCFPLGVKFVVDVVPLLW